MFEKLQENIANKLLAKERAKTDDYSQQKEEMVKSFKDSFKVFRKPYFVVSVEDYNREPRYFTIKGIKLFKIPKVFIHEDWRVTEISYEYELGEFTIKCPPKAEAIRWGKIVKITTKMPVTNTTDPLYYWQSLLEFTFGRGAHKGSLRKTIEKLGKASMGIQFDDYNPHEFEIAGDNQTDMPSFGNSMYFIVDKSYIRSDHWDEYDWATKLYNQNESPMMI